MGKTTAFVFVGLFVLTLMITLPDASAYHTFAPKFTLSSSEMADCQNSQHVTPTGDSDGDGICDAWETGTSPFVINFPTAPAGKTPYQFDCAANPPCPNPETIDVFVEVDYMEGHYPDPQAIQQVKDSFDNMGIQLHVIVDEEAPRYSPFTFMPGYDWPGWYPYHGFDQIKREHFGTPLERGADETDWDNWKWKQKAQTFHYALFLHTLYGWGCTSGLAEIHGNDFAVSLGCFENSVGSTDQQAGTFMHELGHNLGLFHGGIDDDNCKPNYLSIMSYSRQFKDYISNRPLDYSRVEQGSSNTSPGSEMITEIDTDEAGGIDQSDPPNLDTVWSNGPNVVIGPVDPNGMDFDGDGFDTDDHDLNNFGGCGGQGNDSELKGYNDWANLLYDFKDNPGTAGDGSSGQAQSHQTGDAMRQLAGTIPQITAQELKDLDTKDEFAEYEIQAQLSKTKFNEDSTDGEINSEQVKANRIARFDVLAMKLPEDVKESMSAESKMQEMPNKLDKIKSAISDGDFEISISALEDLKSKVSSDKELVDEIDEVIKIHQIAKQVTPTDVFTPVGEATCSDVPVEFNDVVDVNMRSCIVKGKVSDATYNKDKKSITFSVILDEAGPITLKTYRFLDSSDKSGDESFTITLNGNPVSFDESQTTDNQRTITIEAPLGSSTIEIDGNKAVGSFSAPAPRAQERANVLSDEVVCKFGFELIFKPSDEVVCVKPSVALKLLARWSN